MALTATCHLTQTFISLATDGTVAVSAGSAGSIGGGGSKSDDQELTGEFRQYANGVTRLLTGTTTMHTHTLALRALSPAQVTVLKSLVGKTCLFRDTYGRKMYGSFLILSSVTIPLSAATAASVLTDVGLTITETTYSEAV